MLIEASILKVKEIPQEVLRQPETTKSDKSIDFTICNPDNPNIFSIMKQYFGNFQYFKTMSNIFQKKKLISSMSQAPNLRRLLYRCKFESQQKNHEVKICGKNYVSCPYLLKASLYLLKQFIKFYFIKSFNCESSNLIYVVICQECKEECIRDDE